MTVIKGVDPACGGTGILSWNSGKFELSTVKTDPKWPTPKRWDFILEATFPYEVSNMDDVLMMIEQPPAYAGAAGGTALLNGGLFAVLTYEWWKRSIPFVVVQPTQLKQFATGKGNASKEDVLLAVERTYGPIIHPQTVRNNNEADALTLAAMALYYYGNPLCSVPGRNEDVLIARNPKTGRPKIDWPRWTLTGG